MVRLLLLCLAIATAALPATAQDPVLTEIVVEGNTKTQRAVIDRVIDLEPGSPFPLEAFDQVWDRLEDCGYFAFVDLDTEEDDEGNVTLLVNVEEESTFRATPYIRYDRRHKYLLGAAAKDVNLGGRGEVLELQAIVYHTQRARLGWTKPWFLDARGLSLHVDAQWEQGAFVWRPFDYAAWHTLVGLRQDLSEAFYVEAGGGFESFKQKDDYDWPVDGVVAGFGAETRNVTQIRALVGLDTRDGSFYPKNGFFGEVEWLYRTGDEVDGQNGFKADLRGFYELPGKPILAVRAYGHTMDTVGAQEYVLRWGGPETVRGADYAGREGDMAYLLTAELRYPVMLMPVSQAGEVVGLGLHAFMDVGDAWYNESNPFVIDDQLIGNANRALQSFGAGVHVNLLSWQLRFEAAKERDGDWVFEFMDVFNF